MAGEMLRSERYDKNCHRIMRGEAVVGFLLRHANDTWGIYDSCDRKLAGRNFARPGAAMAFAQSDLQADLPCPASAS